MYCKTFFKEQSGLFMLINEIENDNWFFNRCSITRGMRQQTNQQGRLNSFTEAQCKSAHLKEGVLKFICNQFSNQQFTISCNSKTDKYWKLPENEKKT